MYDSAQKWKADLNRVLEGKDGGLSVKLTLFPENSKDVQGGHYERAGLAKLPANDVGSIRELSLHGVGNRIL